MLGAMIGDIVGSKYEFNNTFDYDFEMFGGGCDFTDDTICTVAIADAIQNGRNYQESLLDWCRRYPSPKGAYGGRFAAWICSLNPQPYNSFGNGSAMRVSPVAWLFDDLSQVLEEAEKTALPTHNHPEGIKGAKAVAHAIWYFRKSRFSEESKDSEYEETKRLKMRMLRLLRMKMKQYRGSCPSPAAITRISTHEFIQRASSMRPVWMPCPYPSTSSRKPHLSRMPFASLYLMAAIAIPSEPSSAPSPKPASVFRKK